MSHLFQVTRHPINPPIGVNIGWTATWKQTVGEREENRAHTPHQSPGVFERKQNFSPCQSIAFWYIVGHKFLKPTSSWTSSETRQRKGKGDKSELVNSKHSGNTYLESYAAAMVSTAGTDPPQFLLNGTLDLCAQNYERVNNMQQVTGGSFDRVAWYHD